MAHAAPSSDLYLADLVDCKLIKAEDPTDKERKFKEHILTLSLENLAFDPVELRELVVSQATTGTEVLATSSVDLNAVLEHGQQTTLKFVFPEEAQYIELLTLNGQPFSGKITRAQRDPFPIGWIQKKFFGDAYTLEMK